MKNPFKVVLCTTFCLALVAHAATLGHGPAAQHSGPSLTATSRKPPKHPKLSYHLAELSRAVPQQRGAIPAGQRVAAPPGFSIDTLPKSVRDAVQAKRMHINTDGEVQVYILVSEVTDQNLEQIRSAGATVELHDKGQRIVQARVPVSRLEEVAALPFVRFVRLPDYAVPHTGSVNTEGDSVLKADQVRSILGVNGTGVRVGVISDGIGGIFATGCTTCGPTTATPSPISSGDLSNATGTRNASGILTSVSGGIIAKSFRADANLEGCLGPCGASTVGAEGTAMLEIVHDLAPGAQLFFSNGGTSLEFNQAVNFLAANADVVVDDIGFFAQPYDGTSVVSANTAIALNNNSNPIRAYFTAVANQARAHYRGDFTDSGVNLGGTGDLHLFQGTAETSDIEGRGPQPSDLIHLRTGDQVTIWLTWNDPFGASSNDYDLFLAQKSTGAIVAQSLNPQTGTQDPVEGLTFTNTGAEDDFLIAIQNSQNKAAVRNLNMYVLHAPTLPLAPNLENHNYNTVSSSVLAQSDAGGSPVSVVSVGTANWNTPSTIAAYSSNGPTLDGRLKPDIIAVDRVSITGAGGFSNPFFGTSAAAPHAAGVAALLLQASPCLLSGPTGARAPVDGRTTLRNLLTNTAVSLGSPVPNNVFGFGRLDALAAANRTIPTANAGPSQTLNGTALSGASVTLNGTGSSDPNACPLTLNWTGDCGTATGASPTLTCPLGVSKMNLTVTNNGITLSPPSSVQIAVTDFTAGTSPTSATVKAGQAATYTINLAPKFGTFSNAVSLSCSNLPAGSSCSFSPNTVTPGASGASSTLTISTTAATALLKPPFDWPNTKPPFAIWISPFGLTALGMVLSLKQSRNKFSFHFFFGTLLVFAGFLAACGGGGSSAPPRVGTPSGTFTISVTGTSGSLQHSTATMLVVQ